MTENKYIFANGSRIKDLSGRVFGFLKVNKFLKIENRYALWECTCLKCGKVYTVSARNLLSGRKTTCPSCKSKPAPRVYSGQRKTAQSLTGKKFGLLTVGKLVDENVPAENEKYICACECGNTITVPRPYLMAGQTKSCGCLAKKNITGRTFGLLKAIEPTDRSTKRGIVWKCACECGNVTYVPIAFLLNGDVKSCGCMKEIEEERHTKLTIPLNGGTKLRTDNTTGITGVVRANGKWGAKITFCKKSYWLGTFDTREDAIAARKSAEKHLYSDFLGWYETEKHSKTGDNKHA